MKPVVVIETRKLVDTLEFRFACPRCDTRGAWHPSLNDAERSGERHARVLHAEAVQA